MSKRIVFYGDRFIHGTDRSSNWERILFHSLDAWASETRVEWVVSLNDGGTLEDIANRLTPGTTLVLSLHTDPSGDKSYRGISANDIKMLKESRQCFIVVILGDLELQDQISFCNDLSRAADRIIYTALSDPPISKRAKKIARYSFPPVPVPVYGCSSYERNVGFVGRPRADRKVFLETLRSCGVCLDHTGGEREANLSYEEYRETLNSSKISIGFSRVGATQVINARTFEVIGGDSVLLEQASIETLRFFIPYKHFVPFFSAKDASAKIARLLNDESYRLDLLSNARARRLEFKPSHFWDVGLSDAGLSLLSFFTAIKYCRLGDILRYILLLLKSYLLNSCLFRYSYLLVRRGLHR